MRRDEVTTAALQDPAATLLAVPKESKEFCIALEDSALGDLRIYDLLRTLGSWQAKTGTSLLLIGESPISRIPSQLASGLRVSRIAPYLVIGKATCFGSDNSQIATLVERQTRYVMLANTEGKDTESITDALTV